MDKDVVLDKLSSCCDDCLHDNFILLPPNLPIVKEKTFKEFVEKYEDFKD